MPCCSPCASGNKVLETFWSTISLLAHGEQHGMRYSGGNQAHVIAAHERILAAFRARDRKRLADPTSVLKPRRRAPEKAGVK